MVERTITITITVMVELDSLIAYSCPGLIAEVDCSIFGIQHQPYWRWHSEFLESGRDVHIQLRPSEEVPEEYSGCS